MAALQDLLSQIQDENLRSRIEQEVHRLNKTKKFGLVYEHHLPENTALYEAQVRPGVFIAKRDNLKVMYRVVKVAQGKAFCVSEDGLTNEFLLSDVVVIARNGDPIYPTLQPLGKISTDPDNDLWHTLIEAENYHALQLLDYLYAGKVDCIYIDPPYNTGARDWKYNNDYVDASDQYRHSKWLSMMERRLRIAKRLLNPKDSVLIVTIDEKEYLRLGILLEELFPEARIQMVSSVINPNGAARNKLFTRVDEYIYFVFIGESAPNAVGTDMLNNTNDGKKETFWFSLIRTGSNSTRHHSENCFYPIFINKSNGQIEKIGEPLGKGVSRNTIADVEGCVTLWPLHGDGTEGCWQLGIEKVKNRIEIGAVRVSHKKDKYVLTYLREGTLSDIQSGFIDVEGKDKDGVLIINRINNKQIQAKTVWNQSSHDATTFGSKLLKQIFLKQRVFAYPKSLYAVSDTIRIFVANKPNALILDFFAGSGTTLHAVNLLNAEDGGKRRCIMVTNNEVSSEEAKNLSKLGLHQGDPDWEKMGIARYVTWPRTICSIKGVDIKGEPLKGDYIGSNRPMSQGFKANVEFFKLTFLDRNSISLGREFRQLLPLLWMKAGAKGERPELSEGDLPEMLIYPKNRFAVLINSDYFCEFEQAIKDHQIDVVYIITDSRNSFEAMVQSLDKVPTCIQLYRDYLENFRITNSK